jgi:hypothetical protein
MAYDPGKGALFNAKHKEKATSPDFSGEGCVETNCPHCQKPFAVSFWISGWRNQARNSGQHYQGLSFRDKLRASTTFKKAGNTQENVGWSEDKGKYDYLKDDLDDEIPF